MPLPLTTILIAIAFVALGFHQEAIAFTTLGFGLANETVRALIHLPQQTSALEAAAVALAAEPKTRTIQMQPDGTSVHPDPFGLQGREPDE